MPRVGERSVRVLSPISASLIASGRDDGSGGGGSVGGAGPLSRRIGSLNDQQVGVGGGGGGG